MRIPILKLFAAGALLVLPLLNINVAQAETPAAIEDTSAVGELAYWNKIKGSSDPAELKLYIDTFPQGMFFDLAMSKYLAAGGSLSDLDATAAAPPPKVKKIIEEPEEEVVDVEVPVQKYVKPKAKVKKAYFKPKSEYRKIQKLRYAVKKRAAKRYQAVNVYKRPAVKKRIACAGYWNNGQCVYKLKYKKVRVKYVKPKPQYVKVKYKAPPKPKKVYDEGGGQGSSGGGSGGGSTGGGWGG